MRSVHSISILGCGWLGLTLAEQLIKEGYEVKGSVTKPEKLTLLKEKGIQPFQLELTNVSITGRDPHSFFNSDLFIISIPPGRRAAVISYYQSQISLLIQELKKSTVKQVIFISSTAVYADDNKEVFETDACRPVTDSGKALMAAERLLQEQKSFSTGILRFCGLIGPDRHPGRFLAGKKDVENGDAPVNLIHRDDCIGILSEIIRKEVWGEIFNVCSQVHPSRKLFYTKAAEQLGMETPSFSKEPARYKVVNSDKIKKRTAYLFKYPDPLLSLLNH